MTKQTNVSLSEHCAFNMDHWTLYFAEVGIIDCFLIKLITILSINYSDLVFFNSLLSIAFQHSKVFQIVNLIVSSFFSSSKQVNHETSLSNQKLNIIDTRYCILYTPLCLQGPTCTLQGGKVDGGKKLFTNLYHERLQWFNWSHTYHSINHYFCCKILQTLKYWKIWKKIAIPRKSYKVLWNGQLDM